MLPERVVRLTGRRSPYPQFIVTYRTGTSSGATYRPSRNTVQSIWPRCHINLPFGNYSSGTIPITSLCPPKKASQSFNPYPRCRVIPGWPEALQREITPGMITPGKKKRSTRKDEHSSPTFHAPETNSVAINRRWSQVAPSIKDACRRKRMTRLSLLDRG